MKGTSVIDGDTKKGLGLRGSGGWEKREDSERVEIVGVEDHLYGELAGKVDHLGRVNGI